MAKTEIQSSAHKAATRQLRGSSFMLVGRMISLGLNFLTNVLIVRYFAEQKEVYGAFTYALSIVALIQSFATFGLDRAVTRFLSIYHEREEYGKLFGTLWMIFSTLIGLSTAIILFLYVFQQQILTWGWITQAEALPLVLLLVFLAPVQAFDQLCEGMFAVFSSTKAIFFRKYLLAPSLRLSVVGLLIWFQSDIYFLAGGYLAISVLGVMLYLWMLIRLLQDIKLFEHFSFETFTVPWREVLAFTVPMLSSDLVYVLMNTTDAIMLERFSGLEQIAAFRSVSAAAGMNMVVMSSFQLLFTPVAARMFARHDHQGINHLYWQTAIWIAVASFPLFSLSFVMADQLVVTLYTESYASSGVILALLSLGTYFSAMLGFNGLTLKVYGDVYVLVIINLCAAVLNVVLNLLLIPQFGAVGAAIGSCSTLIIHNLLKQGGLRLRTRISIFSRKHLRVYLVIFAATASLLLFEYLVNPDFIVGFIAATVVSLAVLMFTRKDLAIGDTFPELLRFPLIKRIFGE
jgi:O-antigen/teichoic acid export membrane protein